jgi:hypothetical protein
MSAEQQLKLAVMDSVGDTIRHIIALPPMAFQNMTISDIIEAVRSNYGKTTRHTIKRVKEILTEKLDNARNWRTHSAKMRNAFAISTRIETFARNKVFFASLFSPRCISIGGK